MPYDRSKDPNNTDRAMPLGFSKKGRVVTPSDTVDLDPYGGVAGKGFTCTGFDQAADGTWWVGNFGAEDENDVTVTPSVVHLSADLSTIISETALSSFAGSASTGVQGVAYESDTSIWVVSEGDNKIYNFNGETGALIGSLSKAANGLAYDDVNDQLVIMDSNGKIEWINKATAAVVKTVHVGDGTGVYDQLSVSGGYLLATQGGNRRTGKVYFVSLTTFTIVAVARLAEATAMEGAFYDVTAGKLYVASDEHYHNDPADVNRILAYDVTIPDAPPLIGDRFTVSMLFKHPGTFTGARCLFQIGDPLENTALGSGFGVYTVANVTSAVGVFASKGPGSGNRSSSNVTVDISTDVLLSLDVDMAAATVTPRINGVDGSAIAFANISGGSLTNPRCVIGSALEGSLQTRRADLNLSGSIAVVKNGHTRIAQIEADMMARSGLLT